MPRGRPTKDDDDRLVPAKTSLPAEWFDGYDTEARRRGVPLATVLRERLNPAFSRTKKSAEADSV